MITLNVAAALFALYMLVRHVPRLRAARRGLPAGQREGAFVAALNVGLALLVLATAIAILVLTRRA